MAGIAARCGETRRRPRNASAFPTPPLSWLRVQALATVTSRYEAITLAEGISLEAMPKYAIDMIDVTVRVNDGLWHGVTSLKAVSATHERNDHLVRMSARISEFTDGTVSIYFGAFLGHHLGEEGVVKGLKKPSDVVEHVWKEAHSLRPLVASMCLEEDGKTPISREKIVDACAPFFV